MNKSSTPVNTLFHCFEQGIIFNEWNCRSLKWNRPEVITFLCSTLLGLLKNDNPVLRARSSFLRWPWSEEFILSLSSTISKSILEDKELNLTMAECTPVFRTKTKMIAGNIKVARYSFSGSIPPKFERKLRRHKQRFVKINTTVVLDKDENLL